MLLTTVKFWLCQNLSAHGLSGSFGDVYMGKDKETNKKVAIKVEPKNEKYQQLIYEARLYKILNRNNSEDGIPRLLWYGVEKIILCIELIV
jgi:serine/threonine protein kinase